MGHQLPMLRAAYAAPMSAGKDRAESTVESASLGYANPAQIEHAHGPAGVEARK